MFPLIPSSSFFKFFRFGLILIFDYCLGESRNERKENNNMSRPLMSFQPTSHCYEQGRGTGIAIVLVHIMSLRFVEVVKKNIKHNN